MRITATTAVYANAAHADLQQRRGTNAEDEV